jgi:hypothetical protein
MGQTTAAGLGSAGQTMASNVGGYGMAGAAATAEGYLGAANARASGYRGMSDALTGGLGTYLNYAQNEQRNKLFADENLLNQSRNNMYLGYQGR